VRAGRIGVVVNTPTRGYRADRAGYALRRAASELQVPTLTSLDSARAMLEAFAPSAETDLVPLT
jgi:carbamoyl-phosphate synthase large subunit